MNPVKTLQSLILGLACGHAIAVNSHAYLQLPAANPGTVEVPPNDRLSNKDMTADGRYIVFESLASNFVEDDLNTIRDVFLFDRHDKQIMLISRDASGVPIGGRTPRISADGSMIVFCPDRQPYFDDIKAPVLFDTQTGQLSSIFHSGFPPTLNEFRSCSFPDISQSGRYVAFDWGGDAIWYDRDTDAIQDASVNTQGQAADRRVSNVIISANGLSVAFTSFATNLVADDTDNNQHIYVRDILAATTQLVSRTHHGDVANDSCRDPAISGDGNKMVFTSRATNLVEDHSGDDSHVYLRDLSEQSTQLISRNPFSGELGNDTSFDPDIDSAGTRIVFASAATNLSLSTFEGRGLMQYNLSHGSLELLNAGETAHYFQSFSDPILQDNGELIAVSSTTVELPGWESGGSGGSVYLFDPATPTAAVDWAYFPYSVTNQPAISLFSALGSNYSLNATGSTFAIETRSANAIGASEGLHSLIQKPFQQTGQVLACDADTGFTQSRFATSPSLSGFGNHVAFTSISDLCVSGAPIGDAIAYIKDLVSGDIQPVSTDVDGKLMDMHINRVLLSSDGTHVLLATGASFSDYQANSLYLKDTHSGALMLVPVKQDGEILENVGEFLANATISSDGRFVAFEAYDEISDGQNYASHVFLFDKHLAYARPILVIEDPKDSFSSTDPRLSANGDFVAFSSFNDAFAATDNNGFVDAFVWSRNSEEIELISVSSLGARGDANSRAEAISGDGRFVMFSSSATNLTDTHEVDTLNFYVRDRKQGETKRIIGSTSPQYTEYQTWEATMTQDGRYIAFKSTGAHWVVGDTNRGADVFLIPNPFLTDVEMDTIFTGGLESIL